MSTPLPPIYRDCRRLLVLTEDMVRRFSRYHKYTVGTDLRQSAMAIMRTVNQAVHDKPRQAQHVQALVWRVDDYKLTLQLSMDVGVFAHTPQGSSGQGRAGRGALGFQNFEQAATVAVAVGKQCGGWGQAFARRQRAMQAADAATPPPAGAAVCTPGKPAGCATALAGARSHTLSYPLLFFNGETSMSKLSALMKPLAMVGLTAAVTVWAAQTAQAVCLTWPTAECFTLNGTEVTDQRTGLIWKRCSEGQGWSGSTCTGLPPTTRTRRHWPLPKPPTPAKPPRAGACPT